MATIPFTNNYADLSTPRGFQFKFHCRKCGNGYMSTFQSNTLGAAASVAQSVSGLLGGLFSRAAQSAEQLQQMVAGPQHDSALRAAVDEIRPLFKQCSCCGNWVCEPRRSHPKRKCESCGTEADGSPKFCPECGQPYSK